MNTLHAENISFRYPGLPIIENFSISLTPGKKWSLIGPNGCGKTTLLHLMARMILPLEGRVSVTAGKKNLSRQQFHRISGVVPAKEMLLQDHTFAQNIDMYGSLYDKTPLQDELIDAFDCRKLRSRKVGFLSQGERKKLSIILSLQHDPMFLFLDEPSSGLDQASQDTLSEILRKSSAMVFLVTHHINFAQQFADAFYTFENQKVVPCNV